MRVKFTAASVSLLISTPLLANIAVDDSSIIVSATREITAQPLQSAALTQIGKEELDRTQDQGLSEVLLRTPGVNMVRNGGYGTSTTLRIRGAEGGHTLVVIDGVKMNDPSSTDCSFNFANLFMGDIGQVEILRGPQSTLWGSQAIGGVVNISTTLPEKSLEGTFDLEVGSRNTISARGAIGGKSGPVAWRIGGQTFSTDGISAIAPDFGGEEKDPYTQQNINGRVRIDVADNVSVDFRGYYADARVDIDATNGDNASYAYNREFLAYAGLNVSLLDGRFHNRFSYGYTNTDRTNHDPARARRLTFDANGQNQRFEYQGNLEAAHYLTLAFGAEHEKSEFHSVSPPSSLSRPIPEPARGSSEITGVYGQINLKPTEDLLLTGGVRHDTHDRFGGHTLFSAGAAWTLPTGTTLRASFGEGFKAPSLYQQYSEYGYTGLAPEKASGWEVGFDQSLFNNAWHFGAAWFERTTSNQIIFVSCWENPDQPLCFQPDSDIARSGYYDNVSRSKSYGIETETSVKIGRFSADANYSWIVSEDRSAGNTYGNWLPRRPQHMANASASYALPAGVTLGAAVRYSGASYDNASNSLRLDPYTLVDVRAEYTLSEELRLYGRVENLFDEEYMTANRYGTLGRGVHIGIRGRF